MDEHSIVRSLALRIARDIAPNSMPAQRLMAWAGVNAVWLLGEASHPQGKAGWEPFLASLEAAPAPEESRPPVLDLADELGRRLQFAPFDARLLTLMIACDRLPRLAGMLHEVAAHVRDFPAVLGELAGADRLEAARRVRGSDVLKLGLITFGARPRQEDPVDIRWPLARILDREPAPGELATRVFVLFVVKS